MSNAAADLPRPHRLTVADYYRMAEVGILAPDARVELIDGEIIDMAPPGSSHVAKVAFLTHALVRAADGKALVSVQSPVRLSTYSAPQPDLALLRLRADGYDEHLPQARDVLLIVEVAATSLRFDRDTKLALYARHGIPEVWLVDLGGKRLVRYRAPQQGVYTVVDEPELRSLLQVAALAAVSVELQRLF
jgi:Uma2 family endonuclease